MSTAADLRVGNIFTLPDDDNFYFVLLEQPWDTAVRVRDIFGGISDIPLDREVNIHKSGAPAGAL